MYSQYVTPQSNVLLTNRPNLNDEKHHNVSKTMFQKGIITMAFYAGLNTRAVGAWLTDTGATVLIPLNCLQLCAGEQPSRMNAT